MEMFQSCLVDERRDEFLNLFVSNAPIIQAGEYCADQPVCCTHYPDLCGFFEENAGLTMNWMLEEVSKTDYGVVTAAGKMWIHYPRPAFRTVLSKFSVVWTRQRDELYRIAGITLVSIACGVTCNQQCSLCNSIFAPLVW